MIIPWQARRDRLQLSVVVSVLLTLLLYNGSSATCAGGPPFDALSDNGDWQPQDYAGNRGIKSVALEGGQLVLDAELIGNSDQNSKGEVYLDLCYYKGLECCVPIDLTGHEITATVDIPPGFVGWPSRPNGVQLYVKDLHIAASGDQVWHCQYGPWMNVDSGGHMTLSLRPTTGYIPGGYTEAGFDPARIHIIGVKFAIGDHSTDEYSGPLYVDNLTISPQIYSRTPSLLPIGTPPPTLGPADQITISPDGFVVGTEKWFLAGANWRILAYGQNFGRTGWFPWGNGISRHPNFVRKALDEARRAGIKIIRVGLADDGRTLFNCDGELVGYDDVFRADTRMFLDLPLEAGIRIEFVIVDFHIAGRGKRDDKNVCIRGRSDIMTDLSEGGRRSQFLNGFLLPFLDAYGNDPAVVGFDVINEPEWVISKEEQGGWEDVSDDDPAKAESPVPLSMMRSFITDCISAIRTHAPGKLVTVGVSAKFIALANGLDLDYYALHHYPSMDPLGTYISSIPTGMPWVLEEFPTGSSPLSATDYLDMACSLGASGAHMWNLTPGIDEYTMDCDHRESVLQQIRDRVDPPPAVTSITPSSALNSGGVSITDLAGTGFQSGAAVRLAKSGQSDINADGVTVVSPTKITCAFNLAGKTPGKWNLIVINPGGQSGELADGFTVVANSPPTVSTPSPNSGVLPTGQWITMSCTYADPDGRANLATGSLLINNVIANNGGAHFIFNRNLNKFYMKNNTNATIGGATRGTATTIESENAVLDCAGTTIAVDTNSMTITWRFQIRTTMAGKTCNLYVMATDNSGGVYPWTDKGDVTIGANKPPTAGTPSPNSGVLPTNQWTTMTCTYTDLNGRANLATGALLINNVVANVGGAHFIFNRNLNKFYMKNNANAVIGGVTRGTATTIQSENAVLDCAGTTIAVDTNSMTITWRFQIKTVMDGKMCNLYVKATDNSGGVYPWTAKGQVLVKTVPIAGTPSPNSGTITTDQWTTMAVTYSHPNGRGNLATCALLINDVIANNGGAHFIFNRNLNKFYMKNNVNAVIGGVTRGTATTIESENAILDCAGTTITVSANDITIRWRFQLKPSMSGKTCNLYVMATDNSGGLYPWTSKGAISVETAPLPCSGRLINAEVRHSRIALGDSLYIDYSVKNTGDQTWYPGSWPTYDPSYKICANLVWEGPVYFYCTADMGYITPGTTSSGYICIPADRLPQSPGNYCFDITAEHDTCGGYGVTPMVGSPVTLCFDIYPVGLELPFSQRAYLPSP